MVVLSVAIWTTFMSAASGPGIHDTIPAHKGISVLNLYDGKRVKGYLINASDSTVTLVKRKDWDLGQYQIQNTYTVDNIVSVQKKTRSHVGPVAAFGLGALTGAALGAMFAAKHCENEVDCDFWTKLLSQRNLRSAIALTASLGTIGAVLGVAFSKKRGKRFMIGRSRENLGRQKLDLLYY